MHSAYHRLDLIQCEILRHRFANRIERRGLYALDLHVDPGNGFLDHIAQLVLAHRVGNTGGADLECSLVTMLQIAGLQPHPSVR